MATEAYQHLVTNDETNGTYNGHREGDHPLLANMYMFLSKYIWMIPVVFGIPGNMVSIVVTTREHNRHLSPCVYMSAMAVVDTMLLSKTAWFHPVMYWDLVPDASLKVREILFKLAWYITYTCAILSGLYLAEMSTDRLIAVRFPMAASRLCTATRAKKTVIITTVLISTLNLNIFFTYQYIRDPVTGSEILVASFPQSLVVELLSSGFQLIFGTICPFIVILFCNIWIIVVVRKAAYERKKMGTGEKHGARAEKDTTHLTRMLIMVSIAYLVMSIPYRLYNFILGIPEVADVYKMEFTYWNLRYNVQYWLLVDIWFCNYGINFYLYCAGGGKRYRTDTKNVLLGMFRCFTRRSK